MEARLISEPIQIIRRKSRLLLMVPLILALFFAGRMAGADLPGRQSTIAMEEVFKFKTGITTNALLKTGFSVHFLKRNETLYRLSRDYFVSVASLVKINRISNPRSISVGKMLYIPPVDYHSGRLRSYRVGPGDTVEGLISRFGLELWQFKRINPGLAHSVLEEGTTLILPIKEVNRLSRPGKFISIVRPVMGRLTSRYGRRWGRMHSGIDLAAPGGTPVRTAASGRVVFTGWNGGYGRFIKIDHGNYQTNYGHLSKIIVSNGTYVQKGALIGLVGATGRAYGSHLHFELEIDGKKVDPLMHLR
ncbi:MAG: LysM peptidoglycan-binding domain-containing M23 family metallopeptidase [Bacteroidota bacterium]